MNKKEIALFFKDIRWVWIFLGIVTILIKKVTTQYPDFIEANYSRSFFHGIRWILDHTIGWLPFSFLYILIALLIFYLFRGIWRFFRSDTTLLYRLGQSALTLLAITGGVLFFFQLFWGYNYNRIPVENQLSLAPQSLELKELEAELAYSLNQAMHYRDMLSADTLALTFERESRRMERSIRKEIEKMLKGIGYPDSGNPRLRFLYPKGSLLVWNTAGFYNPLTGECQVDPGLHPIQIPFVMAHEFCHAYGFTDEGSCNFLAWLACTQSEDPLLQYSANLSYWRYLASSYRLGWRDRYGSYFKGLPPGFVADLRAINENSNRYPEFFPQLRYAAYDTYLKSQGVKEGIKSYSRMVLLVSAWRSQHSSTPNLQ